jgi:hypothetical protein
LTKQVGKCSTKNIANLTTNLSELARGYTLVAREPAANGESGLDTAIIIPD